MGSDKYINRIDIIIVKFFFSPELRNLKQIYSSARCHKRVKPRMWIFDWRKLRIVSPISSISGLYLRRGTRTTPCPLATVGWRRVCKRDIGRRSTNSLDYPVASLESKKVTSSVMKLGVACLFARHSIAYPTLTVSWVISFPPFQFPWNLFPSRLPCYSSRHKPVHLIRHNFFCHSPA